MKWHNEVVPVEEHKHRGGGGGGGGGTSMFTMVKIFHMKCQVKHNGDMQVFVSQSCEMLL